MVASESILLDGRAAQTRPSKNLPTMVEFDPILHCEVSIDKTNLKKCKHTVNIDKAILYRHHKSTRYYKRCVLSFNMFIHMTCPKKCARRPFTNLDKAATGGGNSAIAESLRAVCSCPHLHQREAACTAGRASSCTARFSARERAPLLPTPRT